MISTWNRKDSNLIFSDWDDQYITHGTDPVDTFHHTDVPDNGVRSNPVSCWKFNVGPIFGA